MRDHLDIEVYDNPALTAAQMRELRRGLRKGLDVTEYADPSIPAGEVNEMKDIIIAVSHYRNVW